MAKIIEEISKISQIGMSKKDKQTMINVGEVWHIWKHLIARYDIMEMTNVLLTYSKDEDLKLIINQGLQTLEQQATLLEKLMEEFSIPLPMRPPKKAISSQSSEIVNDRYIFRRVLRGIQAIMPEHVAAFTNSMSPSIRSHFKNVMIKEMEIYDNLVEYGKLKGWMFEPPVYRM